MARASRNGSRDGGPAPRRRPGLRVGRTGTAGLPRGDRGLGRRPLRLVPRRLPPQPALQPGGTEAQLDALHTQDAALAQEKKNLSDAGEIGRIAREQYQLVSPGQQAYEVLPPSGATAGGTPYAGDPGSDGPVTPSARPSSHRGVSPPRPPRRPRLVAPGGRRTPGHTPTSSGWPRVAHAARPRILALTRRGRDGAADASVRCRRRAMRCRAVALLLGRDPGAPSPSWCGGDDGRPVVIANEPFLRDGTPMPTGTGWSTPSCGPRRPARGGRRRAGGGGAGGPTRPWPTAIAATRRSATP